MLKFFTKKGNSPSTTNEPKPVAKKLEAQIPQSLKKTNSGDLIITLDTVVEGHNENAPPL